jgi:hypothetical protein
VGVLHRPPLVAEYVLTAERSPTLCVAAGQADSEGKHFLFVANARATLEFVQSTTGRYEVFDFAGSQFAGYVPAHCFVADVDDDGDDDGVVIATSGEVGGARMQQGARFSTVMAATAAVVTAV